MTGIAYNDKLTEPVLSIDELLGNPKLKGKVTLLNEIGDTMALVMLANGDDPAKVTDESFERAPSSGSRRRSTTARSASSPATTTRRRSRRATWPPRCRGRATSSQIGNKHIHWNVPKDGGAIWTDNMLIPKGGDVYTASVYMNSCTTPRFRG